MSLFKRFVKNPYVIPVLCFFYLTSCATNAQFGPIQKKAQDGDFTQALELLTNEDEKFYSKRNQVLKFLDYGLLYHYDRDYNNSNLNLSKAESLIQTYYATSVTQSIASFLTNDLVQDYAGENFEDIYTNLFMALNYIQLNQYEDAFVEIRRFDNKLKVLSQKYQTEIENIKKQAYANEKIPNDEIPEIQSPSLQFHNSAFARYLSMLLYRSINQFDSAYIDQKYIKSAFLTQPNLYPFMLPESVKNALTIEKNRARFDIIAFSGQSPYKREEVIRIPIFNNNAWIKIALPVMEKTPDKTWAISVTAVNQNGEKWTNNGELLENIENIMFDTFQQKQAVIYLKNVLRAIAKTASSIIVAETLDNAENIENNQLIANIFRLVSTVYVEASEQADTRMARFFPAKVWVSYIDLPPDIYTITVSYYNQRGTIIQSITQENVLIKKDALNLREAVWLQ